MVEAPDVAEQLVERTRKRIGLGVSLERLNSPSDQDECSFRPAMGKASDPTFAACLIRMKSIVCSAEVDDGQGLDLTKAAGIPARPDLDANHDHDAPAIRLTLSAMGPPWYEIKV
jgi:hypothetical protein